MSSGKLQILGSVLGDHPARGRRSMLGESTQRWMSQISFSINMSAEIKISPGPQTLLSLRRLNLHLLGIERGEHHRRRDSSTQSPRVPASDKWDKWAPVPEEAVHQHTQACRPSREANDPVSGTILVSGASRPRPRRSAGTSSSSWFVSKPKTEQ
ncbi:unnamed protein product [Pleuronectes platessa]|uniref:Uncharacterized protein n=1 Tax=Pleuronectes platessa TaxID=8262 RepID=A0A9N7Z1L8_PLEPL|nr:unnamed protein product [Pleuronectes platessa]